ncbi:MAG: replication-associated recombination protein A [Anaerolinea sp.]|nr:replication-associated recombination protein A [Anaerolinea sp.]MCC6975906.1 replication-associated recombination protein A [Anaerolineae bacterium]CAG0968194.1 Replication-associated recombination protein A [Anaerolineae bacterium]
MTSNAPGKRRKNQSQYDDDLFSAASSAGEKRPPKEPLADRMRPRHFEEFVGQSHIIGEGRLLRRAIEADRLTSILLWGPPGSGKTTLANIIAHETKAHFVTLNAVLDGIKELREVVEAAESRPRNQRTVLFIDEIHRWNKAQQDSLLPHIESGTITLVGATTENPFFSLVNPLISRSRVFRLETLPDEGVRAVLERAIKDSERGLGALNLKITNEALHHWVDIAHGDARSALNALELAALTTPPGPDGMIMIDLEIAAESIQRRVVRYDRDQDEHYDTISAFIKSMRGSDPDAALYWMAKMLHAGEDPRFLFRRMLILCSEDIGLADPNAIVVVNALADAFERVGMPEGNYFLSHACLYCATAPKSNTASAIFKALNHMEQVGTAPVPLHLRDSTSNAAQSRHDGRESPSDSYKYPHLYPGAWVEQQYLPEDMERPHWYAPKRLGYEAEVYERFKGRGQISEKPE